jgi:hypothetical protein
MVEIQISASGLLHCICYGILIQVMIKNYPGGYCEINSIEGTWLMD